MFGYTTSKTDNYVPLALDISHKILQVLKDKTRAEEGINYQGLMLSLIYLNILLR